MKHADVVVVGAGLSGLAVARGLSTAGADVFVLETRARAGGRILSRAMVPAGPMFDMGPAWIWPHNRRMLKLAGEFGLPVFEQYAQGRLVHQDATGSVRRDLDFAPMAGALRIAGGLGAIIDHLMTVLPRQSVLLGHKVQHIEVQDRHAVVQAMSSSGAVKFHAEQVVIALPPRVAMRDIAFMPGLPPDLSTHLSNIPTWMAGHAKLMAIYPEPFWRGMGLSGDAMSQIGPLAEIHDASPADATEGALFGFVGMSAAAREDPAAVQAAALGQLADLFGAQAGQPTAVLWEDWARAPETATSFDWQPPEGHPRYHRPKELDLLSGSSLHFAGTELAPEEGGFLEGALAASEHVLANLLQGETPFKTGIAP